MLTSPKFTAATLQDKQKKKRGFTLIELSIVLVIIGLIVGGVLVGQDLIRAAEIRATISQIEKYNTAVNTFRGKFNAIPGDMNQAVATTFGFTLARGTTAGEGDGNGVVDGGVGLGSLVQDYGETSSFWVDLSSAAGGNLVDGTFSTATETSTVASVSNSALVLYFPQAKLGRGNFVFVFENNGTNFFGIEDIGNLTGGVPTGTPSLTSMTVTQAYNIDKKVDDGLAASGNVLADTVGASLSPSTNAGTDTSTTCYNTGTGSYSLGQNNGAGPNCALVFKFQ